MAYNVQFHFVEEELEPAVGTNLHLPPGQWPAVGDHVVIGTTCWLCVARLWHTTPPGHLELVLQRNGELTAQRARRTLHIASSV